MKLEARNKLKPLYYAVVNKPQSQDTGAVYNHIHRYTLHMNFFAVVKPTQALTTLSGQVVKEQHKATQYH